MVKIKEFFDKATWPLTYVAWDKALAAPRMLLPSVQINIDAGRLPEPENNGQRYLKKPVR